MNFTVSLAQMNTTELEECLEVSFSILKIESKDCIRGEAQCVTTHNVPNL